MEIVELDNEITEEHLLNFVVNALDDELSIDLGDNVRVSSTELYEVLVGAGADGTSINHITGCTWRRPAVGGAASSGGRSGNSVR